MNRDQSSVTENQSRSLSVGVQNEDKEKITTNSSITENTQEENKKPTVKGQATRNNPLVIAGILFAGAVALTLTWTVGKGEKGGSNPS
jgi:hypothetical protein